MTVQTFTPAELANLVPAYLGDGADPDQQLIVVQFDELGPIGAVPLPFAHVVDAPSRSMCGARDALAGTPGTWLVGFLFGTSDPVTQNVCTLWLNMLGEWTHRTTHGLVVVTDGTATCQCGCSTAAVETLRALATASA